MIEHHRDEEVCRRWDALADEDHTHHLSEQEYFYYKNKWLCLVAVTSLPCNEDFLTSRPSRNLHLKVVFLVVWATGPSSPRV